MQIGGWKNISLRTFSRFLATFSLAVLVFIPIDVLAVSFAPSRPYPMVAEPSARLDKVGPGIEDITAYRQSFKLSRAFGELSKDAGDVSAPASFDKVLANIQLKGIVMIGSPEAILEDKAARRTFFAKAGDASQGFQVKKIGTDSVTFSDGENERTLTLGNGL
jgi:hypothetical protein